MRNDDFETALDRLNPPILLLDSRRRIRFQNAAATALFRTDDRFRVDHAGRLKLSGSHDDARLRRTLAVALNETAPESKADSMSCVLGETGRFVVHAVPIRRGGRLHGSRVLVAICGAMPEACPSVQGAALALGLTRTECALAEALARGEPLADFAERHGMKIGTARWHLKNIESKAGAHRAEQLVALLHDLASPLCPPQMGGDTR
ncbi:helix-turn-helix transcriptional regulator [Thetidibacter halocola]|uniref:helix-turn-helix transcriptional regulator n=1 Tax=Thetidibacter halocola TaxID=2827239 RepID=UPI001BA82C94|nr:helix-turn-helix transcriptional regulator [Thetidibacter halocola]